MFIDTDNDLDPKSLATGFVAALKSDRLDEAEAMYEQLCTLMPESDLVTFRVFLTIQRGRVLEALQFLNELPEDQHPELKAICLNLIKDPTWHSVAESLVDSQDPVVRKAMRQLLSRPLEMA